MPLSQDERDAIIGISVTGTKAELADEIAKKTVLSSDEVRKLLTGIDKDVLARTIAEVTTATKSNSQKAAAIMNLQGGVEALVKIASLVI